MSWLQMSDRQAYEESARVSCRDGRWDDAAAILLRMAEQFPSPSPPSIGHENPFSRGEWTGHVFSLNDTSTDGVLELTEDDIKRVFAYGDTGEGWDGDAAGILELKDGRWLTWESNWGPTGSGFYCDAYGGEADIAVADSPGPCLEYLSEASRGLLRYA